MSKNFKVIYMDDDINDSKKLVVQEACQKLREEFTLFSFDNLSDTNKFFENNVVDAVVLDINMKDGNSSTYHGIRGTDVANSFKRRVNSLPILIFSAAGDERDWFKLSKYGIHAYIDKSNEHAIEELINQLKDLANDKEFKQDTRDKRDLCRKISIIKDSNTLDDYYVRYIEKKCQGERLDYEVFEWNDIKNNFDESKFTSYDSLIWLISQDFDFRRKIDNEILDKICSLSPFPNVIIGAFASDSNGNKNEKILINILNKHPFRIINLKDGGTFAGEMGEALDSAIAWYGKKEVWGCSPDDIDEDFDDDED